MYSTPTLVESKELNRLIDKAMNLPINSEINGKGIVVRAYYQEMLVGNKISIFRAATDVEIKELETDFILIVSMIETSTFSDKDMLVMISHNLLQVETGYRGSDGAAFVSINKDMHNINPIVLKYFGTDNRVYSSQLYDIQRTPSDIRYEDGDENIVPIKGIYDMNDESTNDIPLEYSNPGGIYY